MQRRVPGACPPKQARTFPKSIASSHFFNGSEKLCGWKDSRAADQAVDLCSKRQKGHQKNPAEHTQKNPARYAIRRGPHVIAPKHPREDRKKFPVSGDSGIGSIRQPREDTDPTICRQPDAARPGCCGQGRQNRFRTGTDLAVLADPLHGAGKFLRSNLRETRPDALRGLVVHAVAGHGLPGLDPPAAEPAVAIVNQQRLHGSMFTSCSRDSTGNACPGAYRPAFEALSTSGGFVPEEIFQPDFVDACCRFIAPRSAGCGDHFIDLDCLVPALR